MRTTVEITIRRLGAGGDGIGRGADGTPVYVPGALPGERWRVRLGRRRGRGVVAVAATMLSASADRVTPPCPHFESCGGCAAQHLAPAAYAAWKRGLVVEALSRRGLGRAPVAELVRIPPATRRRARLAAERRRGKPVLGFHRRHRREVVDIATCGVLAPALAAALEPLRDACDALLGEGERLGLQLLASDSGLDVVIHGERDPSLAEREQLAALAAEADFARLTWACDDDRQAIAWRRPVQIDFAGIVVQPPPGGFLQASREGEAAIRAAVTSAVAGAARIADLFCGCGTLALPLARARAVHAIDSDADAVAALRAAAPPRLTSAVRDLFSAPLAGDELGGFNAVIFDPPHAGAGAQAAALAASPVPVVVAVSCNPASFARDARLLADGGYAIESVTPIDQFPWSGEIELVAVFRRD